MNKKKNIIEVIESLTPIWENAKGLLLLMNKGVITNDDIEIVYKTIENKLITIKDKNIRNQFQKSLNQIDLIRQREQTENKIEEEGLKDLESLLEI